MRSVEDEREELDKRLERTNEELNAVLKITSSAFSTLELDKLLDAILKSLLNTLKADAVVILLTENCRVRVFASTGVEEEVKNKFSVPIGEGFAGTIVKTRKPMYIKDARSDPRVISPIIKKAGVRSMLALYSFDGLSTHVRHSGFFTTKARWHGVSLRLFLDGGH